MDDLIDAFHQATTLSVENPSPYYIEFEQGSLFTRSLIPKDTCLSEIRGEQEYTWDISFDEIQSKYLILTEDFALDVSKEYPRNVFTYMRYCTDAVTSTCEPNCQFSIVNEANGNIRIFLYTIKEIQPNQELLYDIEYDCWD
jgi:SET domain-containing protein